MAELDVDLSQAEWLALRSRVFDNTLTQFYVAFPGDFDLNVMDVWREYTGAGVTVAIYDDGVQGTHPELAANYDASLEVPSGSDGAPEILNPGDDDAHGTAVAGIIGADRYGSVIGVAFDATIVGVDLYDSVGRQSGPTTGFRQNFDIVNHSYSWGSFDGWANPSGAPTVYANLIDAVRLGRDGLGTIVVQSASNGRDNLYNNAFFPTNTNQSALTNNPNAVVVANVERNGHVASDSTPGSSILVSAFGGANSIFTTDLTGTDGAGPGDYRAFGGTSAAAPQVAGIVALMLEANPHLGYRDVQEILAYSARHVGSDVGAGPSGNEHFTWQYNGAKDWNGGGLHFSEDYGFGLVDAHAAVRLAETWTQQSTFANRATAAASTQVTGTPIPENGQVIPINYVETDDIEIETISITLRLTAREVDDLVITLRSPSGTITTLLDGTEGASTAGDVLSSQNWTMTSNAFRGESSRGTWTLQISDIDNSIGVNDDSWLITSTSTLTMTGRSAAQAADDMYVYTDEFHQLFLDLANVDSRRFNLRDTDGGNDTINAAATTTNNFVSLNSVTSELAGGFVTIQQGRIENYIGGDGIDHVTGNASANVISGGRGNDKLYGEGGRDVLNGGAGDDILDGGAGSDGLVGGDGNDVYYVDSRDHVLEEAGSIDPEDNGLRRGGTDTVFTAVGTYTLTPFVENLFYTGTASFTGRGNTSENLIEGGANADKLYGYGAYDPYFVGDKDILKGHGGDDLLNGGSGDDWLEGGQGNDTLTGGLDADTMIGGSGDDTYTVDNFGDVVVEIEGEGDNDTVNVLDISGYELAANVENLRVAPGQSGLTTIVAYGNDIGNVITGSSGRLAASVGYELYGRGGSDIITGRNASIAADLLDGGEGDDVLNGLAGDDTLRGGEGADVLDGGAGNDTADYSLATAGVWVNLALGGFGGEAVGDTFNSIENITGSAFGDDLTGDNKANVLEGGSGDDFLDGGAGIDTLRGGEGNDRITADNSDIVDGGAGIEDYVYASATTANGGFRFNVLGTNVEIVQGNSGRDTIDASGVSYGVTILGLNGNDVLTGGSGDDAIFGGEGRDQINGGEGFDQILGEAGNDILVGGGVASSPFGDRLFGGDGNDTLTGSGNGWLWGDDDNDTIYAAAGDWANGGNGNDTIVGGVGFQQIEGGAGNDIMTGGLEAGVPGVSGDVFDFRTGWGADTITDFELGTDRLRFFLANPVGLSGLNVTTVAGGTRVELQGQTIMLSGVFTDKATIEANAEIGIVGTEGDDVLFGTSSNESIQGLGGNDELHGGGGNDRLEGGTGRNELYGDGGDDTLVGGDTVDQMDGGAGNDTLIGGGGQTTMFGRDGDDTFVGSLNSSNVMYGGLGNDSYTGGDLTDWVYETEGGDDTVHAGGGDDIIVDYYGVNELYGEGGNDQIVSATDMGSLLDGGDGNDTLTAAFGGNTLLGGNGNDTLEAVDGGVIANIFTGGAGADIFVYRQGVGIDSNVIVTDFEDGIDTIGLRGFTDLGLVTVTETAEGALIGYVGANSPMLLSGVSASLINQNDFVIL